MLNEGVSWHGRIKVTTINADGTKEVDEFDNLITDAGLNLMRRSLRNSAEKTQILYVALGTGTATPVGTDTTLGAEQFRKQVTAYNLGATGAITTTTYISPGEANSFEIQEIGWFAGAATGAVDSGTMIARVLYNKLKDNTQAIQIDRTDTFS